ncbi:hypothetical protein B0A48_18768 [Cryoendolithus antarcticus]|uniref:BZIP domain-containing protein n=1 Tax=Cryoendolithus antarcticus TaxID=1507870 RepID=A0A1V8S8F5_9PEZI|nr:hypothetical protein B0A48_18768 [Cryoendolithus antarcticus]
MEPTILSRNATSAVQTASARMDDEFAAMQQAFGGTEKGTGEIQMNRLSFQNNAGGFSQYEQQLLQIQQAAAAAGARPDGGGAAPAFILGTFQQRGDVRQVMSGQSVSAIVKYGQVTPPDDSSSEAASDSKTQTVARILSEERGRNDKSERARNAAMQRHSKSTKQRRGSQVSRTSCPSNDDEGNCKKEKCREKNRLAAAKCRAKKKDNIEGIEDRHRNLSAMNSALKKQVQDLRGELANMRTHALDHQGCSCRIAKYNVNQAQKVAMGVDGIGSRTGYGAFGYDPDFMYGHGHKSDSAGSPQEKPSVAKRLPFAAAHNFAFNGMMGGQSAPGDMELHVGSEAEFAEYPQAEFGAQDGFVHEG